MWDEGGQERRSKMIRPLMGVTWERRQVREGSRWVVGRRVSEWKMSRAESIGTMSPSWTLKGWSVCSLVNRPRHFNAQAEEQLPSIWPLFKKIGCSIQPQPAHRRSEPVPWPSAVIVDDISRILEVEPIFMRESVAPGTTSSGKRLEATHLLHAVDLPTRECDVGVLLVETSTDRWQIGGGEFRQLRIAIIMTQLDVAAVVRTGVLRCQRVRTEICRAGNDVEDRSFRNPVKTE